MNRRTTLKGLGALIAGGGVAAGTGAFNQVSADRSVSVTTAGDSAALLELTSVTENSGFVTESGGTLQLNLDGNGGGSGDGFNYDAVSFTEPLFRIKNAGNTATGVRIGANGNTNANVSVGSYAVGDSTVGAFQYANTDTVNMTFYVCDTGTLSGDNDFSDSSLETLTGTDTGSVVQSAFGDASSLVLGVDASVEVAFGIDTTGAGTSTVSEGSDLLNEIEVVASSEQA